MRYDVTMPSPLRNQRGQSLVFSLITASIILLVMVSMYTMGQQSLAKIKLQNTADAAAYSAVLAEARDYNFSAYTTRAVIANQVAVAQVVGLTSWARGVDKSYNGPASWLPKTLASLGGPVAKVTWKAPATVMEKGSSALKSGMNSAGPVAAKALELLIQVLSKAQMFYHYGTALTVAQTIGLSPKTVLDKLAGIDTSDSAVGDLLEFNATYNIVKLNDSDAGLSTPGVAAALIHLVQWYGFTEKKDPNTSKDGDGEKSDRMAQVTVDSLDGFSRDRSTKGGGPWRNMAESMYIWPAPFTVDPTRFIPYQTGAALLYLWHRGGTELKDVGGKKKTWSAMDATGFFGLEIFWISILGIPIPIPIPFPFIPMGWGSAEVGDHSNLSASNNFGKTKNAYGGVYENVNTAGAASLQRGLGADNIYNTGGLREYYDVKKIGKDALALTGPALILEVEKEANKIPSSNNISNGSLALADGTKSGYMRALSRAEVYFSRPSKLWKRADGKAELGSLYSPYWQARLAPNGFAEQYASLTYHLW